MAKKKHQSSKMELNLTSMMDVTFQLILFFLLINNMSSAELPDLESPDPDQSKAIIYKDRQSMVVNVIPMSKGADTAKTVRVGIKDILPGNYRELTDLLKVEKEKNADIEVDLRADKALKYTEVQPVMQAITAAGISRINLIALAKEDKK